MAGSDRSDELGELATELPAVTGAAPTVAGPAVTGDAPTVAGPAVTGHAATVAGPGGPVRRPSLPGLVAGDMLGKYQLVGLLGRGGMGEVWAAHDPDLDRRVAIKVLHGALARSSDGRARLQREGRAMGRLKHPNVITVHEATFADGRALIAMELIDGASLADWLAKGGHSQDAIVKVLLAAGRGLAAAHDAGMVHRDFKPHNVLVENGGRVVVTDFGLARAASSAEDTTTEPACELDVAIDMTSSCFARTLRPADGGIAAELNAMVRAPRPTARGALESPLTETGALLGTPAYMAPEQLLGHHAEAPADQFAFCVTAWEALTGERPYQGGTIVELSSAMTRAPRLTSAVPIRVRRVLLRGLAVDPATRWPSMTVLLAAFRRAWTLPRRVAIGATAVVVGLGVIGGTFAFASGARDANGPACADARARLDGVWDASTREAIGRAFLAAGGDRAPTHTSLERTSAALDRYAARWVAGHTEACRATAVHREQSTAILDLRMHCLDRRRAELAALTRLLATADREVVANAPQAAFALPSPEMCADREALAAGTTASPPGTAAAVAEIRGQLAEVTARQAAGKWNDGLVMADAAVAAARAHAYPPLLAEALFLQGTLQRDLRDGRKASITLHEVTLEAARAHDDVLLARAWTELVYVSGFLEGRPVDAIATERMARSMVLRIGAEPRLEARLESSLAGALARQTNFADARTHEERALALREAAVGADHPEVAESLHSLATIAHNSGRYEDAIAAADRAIALRERLFGPEHPLVGRSLGNKALSLRAANRVSESLALFQRVHAILERALGPDAADVAMTLTNTAYIKADLDEFAEAAALQEQALRIMERRHGPDNPQLADALSGLGRALVDLDRCDDARAHLDRAVRLLERSGTNKNVLANALRDISVCQRRAGRLAEARATIDRAIALDESLGADHPAIGDELFSRAALLLETGRATEAHADFSRGLAIRTKSMGTDSYFLNEGLVGLGRALTAMRRPDEAVPHLERALASLENLGAPLQQAECRYALARALWDSDATARARAVSLAAGARDLYERRGRSDRVAEIEQWLARHRP